MDVFFTRIIFSFANKIIVHSDAGIAQCKDQLDIPARKLIKIPHGILRLTRGKGITKKKARIKLNIPLDKKVILYFGNIRKYKGLDTLIEAFSLIARQHNNAILIVAGKPWENWKKYEVLIQKHNLINKIKLFLDYIPQSEIRYFFSVSDLVVLPYKKFTSQSGVGMLALPFHKPLIVTEVGGLPELVLDKNLIVPPDNPQLLAERISQVMKDEDLLKKFQKDSEVTTEFSWRNISENIVMVYEELLRRE
jgi:glycosyltransferase involved in cell wall biosynthesis